MKKKNKMKNEKKNGAENGLAPGARHNACDTAQLGRLRHGHCAHDTAGRSGHDTAMRARAWAHLCTPGCAGWVSWAVCAHCALDQFLTQYCF